MGARETDIQNRTLARLSEAYHPRGLWWRNNTGTARAPTSERRIAFGVPGSPDILGCLDGRFVGVEVKTPAGRQSDAQRRFQAALEAAGGVYVLARSPDEAVDAIGRAV